MKRNLILFLFASLFSSFAHSAPLTPAVVKTYSQLCKGSDKQWRGSGLLVKISNSGQERFLVVSSEHVFLHGNQYRRSYPICHAIDLGSKKLKGELIRADFARGLALLEIKGSPSDLSSLAMTAVALDSMQIETAKADSPVTVLGYPADSLSLLTDSAGRVAAPSSQRHLFFAGPNLIELMHAHGEFGMSGGVVTGQSGSWMGMLSHQVLEMVAGKKSTVKVMGQNSSTGESVQIDNQLLVIPADSIMKWIAQTLNQESNSSNVVSSTGLYYWDFTRSLSEQLQGIEAVRVGPLLLEWNGTPPFSGIGGASGSGVGGASGSGVGGSSGSGVGGSSGSGVGGSSGSGVGGSSGSGVGGSSGSGVGGDGDAQNTPKNGAVKVSWISDDDSTLINSSLPTNLIRYDWFSGVYQRLLREREPLWVAAVYLREEKSGLTRYSIPSITNFFALIRNTHTRAAVIDPVRKDKNEAATAIARTLTQTTDQLLKNENLIPAQPLLKKIRLIGLISQSDDQSALLPSDFAELDSEGPYREQWNLLFNKEFDTSVQLLRQLSNLQEAFKI